MTKAPYPPARTGLRGTHEGSFEAAHLVALARERFELPSRQTDETYDLVVVGAGISGLTAAWAFRREVGADARILILDNHDDFGGHAKRVEFDVDGRTVLSYGGSQTLVAPQYYPEGSQEVLRSLGVDWKRFRDYFDVDFYDRHTKPGIFFDQSRYGVDRLAPFPFFHFRDWVGVPRSGDPREMISQYPISDDAKKSLIELFTATRSEVYPGLDKAETFERLKRQTYTDYLRERFGMPEDGVRLLRDFGAGGGVMGLDSQPAGYAPMVSLPLPGIENYDTGELLRHGLVPVFPSMPDYYIAHFPDGNASLARMLVRALIPDTAPGSTMEDVVTARFDYGRLDEPSSACRIRLESTAVDVRHVEGESAVDVTYVSGGDLHRARGRHVVMACWNKILRHICPELGEEQREALDYPSKMPSVYAQVALRDWRAVHDSGFGSVYAPQMPFTKFLLDFPVSMGDYRFGSSPDEPAVITALMPVMPRDSGLSNREQYKAGRHRLLLMQAEEFESTVSSQLASIWGPYGLDPERTIAGITVNRWPHGYAFSYSPLFDPHEWNDYEGPHVTGRQQIHRISIANSDAGSNALAEVAMEQALRAVREQLAIAS